MAASLFRPFALAGKKTAGNLQQAMITLRGMAEHRFNNVYNYQCLMWILTFPLIPFPSYLLYKNIGSICAISFAAVSNLKHVVTRNFDTKIVGKK